MPNHIEYLEIAFKVSKIIPKSIIDFKVSKIIPKSIIDFKVSKPLKVLQMNLNFYRVNKLSH
jgi:hypothetical protein